MKMSEEDLSFDCSDQLERWSEQQFKRADRLYNSGHLSLDEYADHYEFVNSVIDEYYSNLGVFETHH